MPRKYKRVTTSEKPSEESLQLAVDAVLGKRLTIRSAAEHFGLKKSTLGRYCLQHASQRNTEGLARKAIKKPHHASQIFTFQQEEDFSSYLKDCCLLNHGLTPNETRKLAMQYAVAHNLKCPTSWIVKQQASRDWLTFFLKRNPTLSIRKPEATSQARAAGFNLPVVNEFYDNLLSLLTKYKFGPCDIWNCDETNVPTVLQPPDVIATKGLKQVCETNVEYIKKIIKIY